jgi:hypothetical protein
MLPGLRIGWEVYVGICVGAPLLWGLAVYLILCHRPQRRRQGPPPGLRTETRTETEDYRI